MRHVHFWHDFYVIGPQAQAGRFQAANAIASSQIKLFHHGNQLEISPFGSISGKTVFWKPFSQCTKTH